MQRATKVIATAPLHLRAGDLVKVRTKEEILSTLDANGRLDELPFMPEMLQHCGKVMRVGKRAHKTCDPALGIVGRKMLSAVHLENIRCDGSAHDGCQARCLIFWKEAWLKRPDGQSTVSSETAPATTAAIGDAGCLEAALYSTIKIPAAAAESEPTYVCQNTQVKFATQPLEWWDGRQYVEDYTSGNVRLSQLLGAFIFTIWRTVADAGLGVGTAMRWTYDFFQRLVGGSPYPLGHYGVPKGMVTPKVQLELEEGEIVRVKPLDEIMKTLDTNYRNRGLYFDAEMAPFTQKTYEVDYRVRQIIDEKSCRMVKFKSDAIVLKHVACEARYATCRRFCPREIYPYWREIWLEREQKSEKPK